MTTENQDSEPDQQESQVVPQGRPREVRFERLEFEGPLPPPGALRAYDSILPGAAERILSMAEQQAEHRQNIERKDSWRASLGVVAGTVVAFAVLCLAGYALYLGQPLVGGALGVADLVGLVGVYVYGTRARESR